MRHGKAQITDEKCIDCGECIRQCPYHAKRAIVDSLDRMENFKYNIALPAPALYGQFTYVHDVNYILTALLDIGFDKVCEVAMGAEIISAATKEFMDNKPPGQTIISSACPAIARLVQVKFPRLCDQVLPLISPMQAAARKAKEEAILETGLSKNQIGVFFITPCPAKATDIRQPIGMRETWVNGAFSIVDLYPKLLEQIKKIDTPKKLAVSGMSGVRWASSGGEASGLSTPRYLAADGIENVTSVLEELEDDRLTGVDFIELNACPGGCVGGVLTVENPYLARARIQNLPREYHTSVDSAPVGRQLRQLKWQRPLKGASVMQLADNLRESLEMMAEVERIHSVLPDLDCGSCGAPTCRSMAEDIVKGEASLDDCTFILREKAESAGIVQTDDKKETDNGND